MPEPDGDDEIVLNDFGDMKGYGGVSGKGGNAVFGGHVDSGSKPCSAGMLPPPCPYCCSFVVSNVAQNYYSCERLKLPV